MPSLVPLPPSQAAPRSSSSGLSRGGAGAVPQAGGVLRSVLDARRRLEVPVPPSHPVETLALSAWQRNTDSDPLRRMDRRSPRWGPDGQDGPRIQAWRPSEPHSDWAVSGRRSERLGCRLQQSPVPGHSGKMALLRVQGPPSKSGLHLQAAAVGGRCSLDQSAAADHASRSDVAQAGSPAACRSCPWTLLHSGSAPPGLVTAGSQLGHSRVTAWSQPGHSRVTAGSQPGHSRVTAWSQPGCGGMPHQPLSAHPQW